MRNGMDKIESLVNDFKEDIIDLGQVKDRLFEILLENKESSLRLIQVLVTEVASNAYRAGYAGGINSDEYSFQKFIETQREFIIDEIGTCLERLVEIDY